MGLTFDSDTIPAVRYTCGWCGHTVASNAGWRGEDSVLGFRGQRYYVTIALCPNCAQPTYLRAKDQTPGAPVGDHVAHLPSDVSALYDEARSCAKEDANTAAVLLGRKILMHVAVEKGALPDKTFAFYVTWLVEQHIVTADMRGWLDEIRTLGNDANHEITLMSPDEATALLTFVSMLLKIVYEYPERGRQSVAAREARQESDEPS